jgi:hypothetical protein
MNEYCISCHQPAEDIDPVTGLCYECMEWCVDGFPEFDDEFDDEAEV